MEEKNFNSNSEINQPWIKQHNPSDEELAQLYKGATALVYPSLYEGFGIPPLEALSCGCPVILSNIQVFRELYEGNAIFVDPLNINEIELALTELIANNDEINLVEVSELRDQYSYEQSTDILIGELEKIN